MGGQFGGDLGGGAAGIEAEGAVELTDEIDGRSAHASTLTATTDNARRPATDRLPTAAQSRPAQ
ncbi:hypothetical protein GCM10009566_03790 [Streptomyces murinus]